MAKDIQKQDSKSTALNTKKLLRQQKVATFFSKSTAIIFLTIMSIIVIIPFYWMLNTSVKTPKEQDKFPPTLYPHEWTFENYRIAFLGKKKVTLDTYENIIKNNPGKIQKLEEEIKKEKPEYDKALAELAKFDQSTELSQRFLPSYIPIYKKLLPYIEKEKQIKELTRKNADLVGQIFDENKAISEAKNEQDKKVHQDKLKQYEAKKLANENLIKQNEEQLKSTEYKNILNEEQDFLNKNNQQKYSDAYLKPLKVKNEYDKKVSKLALLRSENFNARSNIEQVKARPEDSFKIYIFHTLVVGISSTIIGTLVSIIGAFALSRLSFKGKDTIFTIMLSTMMIPGEMMVISNFITVTRLGWTDHAENNHFTYLAMVVPFLVTVFHIYLLRQTFKQIPDELYYAAKVDGTSDFKYLWKVMVPLAKSSIITIVILKLMGTWNAYIWPNLVGKRHQLITVWLRTAFTDAESGRVALETQMAATVLVLLPLLFVFLFLRKYIMRGVSRGGTKG